VGPGSVLGEGLHVQEDHLLLKGPDGAAALGAYRRDLRELYWEWEQDPAVLAGLGRQTLPSPEEHAELVHQRAAATLDCLLFTVYDMTGEGPVPAGVAGVEGDFRRRKGMFYIALGSEAHRNKGVGSEAARLVLDYAFHVANLESVWLVAYASNTRAIRAYQRAGFRKAGVIRRGGYWMGERVDEVMMDAVPQDFTGISAVKQRVALSSRPQRNDRHCGEQ